MAKHEVRRLTTARVHILTCSCGKRLIGLDEIDCYRKHELHILACYERAEP